MLLSLDYLRVGYSDLTRSPMVNSVSGGYGTVWFGTLKTPGEPKTVAVKELRHVGDFGERSRTAIVSIQNFLQS